MITVNQALLLCKGGLDGMTHQVMWSNLVPQHYFTQYLVLEGAGAEGGLINPDFSCDDESLILASCFSVILEVRSLIVIGCI